MARAILLALAMVGCGLPTGPETSDMDMEETSDLRRGQPRDFALVCYPDWEAFSEDRDGGFCLPPGVRGCVPPGKPGPPCCSGTCEPPAGPDSKGLCWWVCSGGPDLGPGDLGSPH